MSAADGVLLADWGTTNLRAWRLDRVGKVAARADFALGVARLTPGEAAARFESEVRPALAAQDLPALLCGMIGSTLGWTLAPYVDCPASLESLAEGLSSPAPGVRIVPGLRGPGLIGPDVMRGEETQILGWLAADPARLSGVHTLCLPGTHAKWVRVEEGRLIRFVTAMTGELYDLLGAQSVLRFAGPPGPIDLVAFDAGVAAAADGGALAARLFGLRGLTLNGGLAAEAASSWLSGLLIGAEIAALQPGFATRTGAAVHLIGATRLCGLYARALAAKDVSCEIADGEEAVLAGLTRIWSAIA